MLMQFARIMRLMAVFSIIVAALAVWLVVQGDNDMHVHMVIATALGVAFTVLLGTGLMTLAFLSARSGHDNEVRRADHQEED